jgi:hypothetical protein
MNNAAWEQQRTAVLLFARKQIVDTASEDTQRLTDVRAMLAQWQGTSKCVPPMPWGSS